MTRKLWQQWHRKWLKKRIPPQPRHSLNMNNIFIFPSGLGLGLLVLCALLFLLGTNYQNNLILIMSYFLVSLMLTSMFISYRNFSGLQFSVKARPHCFSGDTIDISINRCDQHSSKHGRLHIGWMNQSTGCVLDLEQNHSINLALSTHSRGYLTIPRITIESFYPLGVFRCWTHLQFPVSTIVYPKPGHRFIHTVEPSDSQSQGLHHTKPGHEDFQSLAPYRPGDPLHQIAWKHVAKGHDLMRKEFSSPQGQTHWLRLGTISGQKLEQRLTDLCGTALSLHQAGQRYGLTAGRQTLTPDTGTHHLHQCLKTLALYESVQS